MTHIQLYICTYIHTHIHIGTYQRLCSGAPSPTSSWMRRCGLSLSFSLSLTHSLSLIHSQTQYTLSLQDISKNCKRNLQRDLLQCQKRPTIVSKEKPTIETQYTLSLQDMSKNCKRNLHNTSKNVTRRQHIHDISKKLFLFYRTHRAAFLTGAQPANRS